MRRLLPWVTGILQLTAAVLFTDAGITSHQHLDTLLYGISAGIFFALAILTPMVLASRQ